MLQRYRSELADRELYENPRHVHKEARRKKNELDRELSAVWGRLAELKTELAGARSTRKAAESAALNADRAVQQLTEKIEALETRQEAVATRMEEMDPLEDPDLYKQVAREKDEIDEQIEALVERRKEKKTEARKQTQRREAAAEDIEQLQGRIQAVREQGQQVDARVQDAAQKAHRADTQRDMVSLLVRVHRRMAWALSILGFTLMGIPLGVMAGSRSIMVAFGISFLLVLMLFYVPLSAGIQWSNEGVVHPAVGIWAGNVLICLLGLVLTCHVCRR
jgi:lipopolysaccharide export LptBFGC system permease protein LptF